MFSVLFKKQLNELFILSDDAKREQRKYLIIFYFVYEDFYLFTKFYQPVFDSLFTSTQFHGLHFDKL